MSNANELFTLAQNLKIKIHEPFAEFLQASPGESAFEISLLDCYRLAGHACLSITGAFLTTAAAVNELFPDTKTCERGDIAVELGSDLQERASGPRANVISYLTGAWGTTGFGGLNGKFSRKDLIGFGQKELAKNAVRFHRISTGEFVDVTYDPSPLLEKMNHGLEFPQSWRAEVSHVLQNREKVLRVASSPASCSGKGCC